MEASQIFSLGVISLSAIFGALVSIIANVAFSNYMQGRRVIKEQKIQILRDLMATRFNSPLDQKAAESINFIPVLFMGKEKVIKAYEDYCHFIYTNSCGHKFNTLVAEIAKDVGITFKPTGLMLPPIYSKKLELEQYEFNKKYEVYQKEIKANLEEKNK